jgi:hypothetical protein
MHTNTEIGACDQICINPVDLLLLYCPLNFYRFELALGAYYYLLIYFWHACPLVDCLSLLSM